MKKIYLALIASCLLLVSCGTANQGSLISQTTKAHSQYTSVKVETFPENAKVYLNDELVSTTTPATISLPTEMSIKSMTTGFKTWGARIKSNAVNLKIIKEGYEIYERDLIPSGNMYSSILEWPKSVLCELTKKPNAYETDPTIPIGAAKERVTRDNPGQTSLERTIIRWYFDSAPQGARIFWRVISSVPNEVKNTNELWLGSTPFEETRSFNIQGLTYENSRDVQIEIKVKRKGYIDQNKRFNVRQAIDQQEISSFFDMVEE